MAGGHDGMTKIELPETEYFKMEVLWLGWGDSGVECQLPALDGVLLRSPSIINFGVVWMLL